MLNMVAIEELRDEQDSRVPRYLFTKISRGSAGDTTLDMMDTRRNRETVCYERLR